MPLDLSFIARYFPVREGKWAMVEVAAIGSTIRGERKALGLRQDELAAASGVGLRFLVET